MLMVMDMPVYMWIVGAFSAVAACVLEIRHRRSRRLGDENKPGAHRSS